MRIFFPKVFNYKFRVLLQIWNYSGIQIQLYEFILLLSLLCTVFFILSNFLGPSLLAFQPENQDSNLSPLPHTSHNNISIQGQVAGLQQKKKKKQRRHSTHSKKPSLLVREKVIYISILGACLASIASSATITMVQYCLTIGIGKRGQKKCKIIPISKE